MDQITLLIHERKPLSFPIFLNVHSRLCMLEMNKGEISFDDILENVRLAADPLAKLSENEIIGYAGAIYEAIIVPKLTVSGPVLHMKKEAMGNDEYYFKHLLLVLDAHCGGNEELLGIVFGLRKVVEKFLKKSTALTDEKVNGDEGLDNDSGSIGSGGNEASNNINNNDPKENEHLTRFLAYLRYRGMDLLFPQEVHDKILLVIYVACKTISPLAYRELMDMVTTIKEAGIVPGIENVSKTKIRSIFALLKNSQALLAINADSNSVRLYLGKSIHNFREFRQKHDTFLSRCILKQATFHPLISTGEVLWPNQGFEPKLQELTAIQGPLEEFFASANLKKAEEKPAVASSTGLSLMSQNATFPADSKGTNPYLPFGFEKKRNVIPDNIPFRAEKPLYSNPDPFMSEFSSRGLGDNLSSFSQQQQQPLNSISRSSANSFSTYQQPNQFISQSPPQSFGQTYSSYYNQPIKSLTSQQNQQQFLDRQGFSSQTFQQYDRLDRPSSHSQSNQQYNFYRDQFQQPSSILSSQPLQQQQQQLQQQQSLLSQQQPSGLFDSNSTSSLFGQSSLLSRDNTFLSSDF